MICFRVRTEISSTFQVLRRLSGKAPKRRNIEIFLRLGNTARQDASAHKMGKLFLREPLGQLDGAGCEFPLVIRHSPCAKFHRNHRIRGACFNL
jgi:hypothetical protein